TGQTSWHERIDFRSLRIADVLARPERPMSLWSG
ncbi:MAG: hypothetical protein JWP61_1183, partial [Friedmanniella sp.]|nr:hypothetical protein [Friedmanniella sp.]